jgi:hypothetical protein
VTVGYFQCVLRCPVCGLVERVGFKTPLVWDPFEVWNLGDSVTQDDIDGLAATYLPTNRPEGEAVTILERYECAGCHTTQWCRIVLADSRIADAQAVRLTMAEVDAADYLSPDFDETFKQETGESIFTGQEVRHDWMTRLRRSPLTATTRLECPIPRPGDATDDPGEFLLALAEAPGGRLVRVVETPTEVPGYDDDTDDTSVAIEVSPWRDTGRPAWRFLAKPLLDADKRQREVIAGRRVAVAEDNDYPCGATVDDAWVLVGRMRGNADRGVYLAMHRDGRYGIATLTSPQRDVLGAVRARLMEKRGLVVSIVALDVVQGVADGTVALIEAEPAGRPLANCWFPMRLRDVVSLAGSLFGVLGSLATALGGLRPETIYIESQRAASHAVIITGIAPRGEAFMAGQAPRSVGSVTPYRYLYDAPEVLRGAAPTLASDVFAATAVIAHMATGAHPFEGESAFTQMSAILGGHRRVYHGPPALEPLLARGLAADPAQRPSAGELAAAFTAAIRMPGLGANA